MIRKNLYIRTYGCQMNFHDSERIAGILTAEGYQLTDTPEEADLIIFNTCSIREKAEQKFYSDLGRLKNIKKKSPQLKIGVGGCIAQQAGEGIFKRVPYVNFILGPQNLESLPELILGRRKISITDHPDYDKVNFPSFRSDTVRAWVSIMYGCNNFCSYCVVPYTRGREMSRPITDIVREVDGLALNGYKEVTLLGQNVNSYGQYLEKGTDFSLLLDRIHDIDGIERIRFVTSHPKDLSHKLIKTMKNLPKICEHLHLPLQAGSDKILHFMNRGYTYVEYKEKVDLLRREIHGIAITTDIITGFPGESDEDFDNTIRALKDVQYDGIFAFKYSKRPDTSAINLPDHLPEPVKAGRLSQVLEVQNDITFKKNKELVNRDIEILIEGKSKSDKDRMTGRTRTNKIVNFDGDTSLAGKLLTLRITKARHHSLQGELL